MSSGPTTNALKRGVMRDLMQKALRNYSKKRLAEILEVKPSSVDRYARGASMGTNAQRARLAALIETQGGW